MLLLAGFLLMATHCEKYEECDQLGTLKDASDLDGCTFIILADDGKRYEPISFPEGFEPADSMRISFSCENVEYMSICMSGQPVKITCISPYYDNY